MGGTAITVDSDWGRAVDPKAVEETLNAHPDAKVLAFVHAETSTGARSDAKTLCQLARKHNCLTIVDTVTSLAGSELEVDGWGVDAVYSGSQKCLSCVPGLSPVSFSEAAVEKIQARKTPVRSWFLDMNLVMGYWGGGGWQKSLPSYGTRQPIIRLARSALPVAGRGAGQQLAAAPAASSGTGCRTGRHGTGNAGS
ncbi:aminotransferase class V-fold PLP-dependent enzyme [Endozoicomonas sp. GU-1]